MTKLQKSAETARRTATGPTGQPIVDRGEPVGDRSEPTEDRADAIHVRGLARIEKIAQAAHGLDDVEAELLAQPADEHLDGVRIAVEVLVVKVLVNSPREMMRPVWCIR